MHTHTLVFTLSHSMEKLSKITAPAGEKLRQLQKIVQDIKKNDDSIFNRLKRIKNKGPPKVPARDYPGDNQEAEWSGSDFDSDVYEDPQGDHDDSYEPPPCERAFPHVPSISYPAVGDYVDKCPGRPTQAKPARLLLSAKPPVREKPNQAAKDDEDYIDPKDDVEEDNYIDPSEKDPHTNKGTQLGIPRRSHSPDVYEVPDTEDSPPSSRCNTKRQPPAMRLPPKPSPRINIKKPVSCLEPEGEDDYEVCNTDESPTSSMPSLAERPEKKSAEDRRPSIPVPLPRDQKFPKPSFFQKTSNSTRDHEASPSTVPPGFYRVKMSLPRELPQQKPSAAEDSGARQQEEEAGVYKRPWYASTCDRKTAEDALIRSAKDGSYLVRKSSGVDALQPYTLVVFYNGRVYNIPVRYIPNTKQFALGKQKNGEERFNSVSDIIENHQKNALVLVDTQSNTKDSTKLKHAVKL